MAIVIDESIVAGKLENTKEFMRGMSHSFDVGKVSIGGSFDFNGSTMKLKDNSVKVLMWMNSERIKLINMSRNTGMQERRKRMRVRLVSSDHWLRL